MRRLWCVFVVGVACASGPARPVPVADQTPDLVLPPALRTPGETLLLGDLHGTAELPAFVGRVVSALAASQPVVLGLEIRSDQAPSIPAFLASDGGPEALAAMLRDRWWQDPYQDGRRSMAMLALLDTARRLRMAGKQVDVALFDAVLPDGSMDAEQREAAMAATVLGLRAARPEAALVVYAGNLHTMRKGVDFKPGFAWMAMRMARAGVVFTTLGPRYRDGSTWMCTTMQASDCGMKRLGGTHDAPGIYLEASPDGNYDGWFDVGPITASPPAASH